MMHWQYPPYVLPLLIAAAVSAVLMLHSWRFRSAPGAIPFTLLSLAVTVQVLGYALELASVDLPTKLLWGKVAHLGMAIMPTAWLALALQYTGQEKWLTRRNLACLAIEPLVTLLLAWTNEWHLLIYSRVRLDTSGLFSMLEVTFGVWSWVDIVYSYLLLILGTILLIQAFTRSPRLYRRQVGALLIGAFAPWIAEVVSISGLNPLPHLDLTPFAFTLTSLAAAWALFSYQLLDIAPVAHDAVIRSMSEGVVVIDAQNRVVSINPAAQRIIGLSDSEVTGQPVTQVLIGQSDGLAELAQALVTRYHDVTERHEIVLGEGEAQFHYDLCVSPLYDRRSRLTGRLAILRDITERKQAEEQLRLLSSIVEQTTEGMAVADLNGNLLFVNNAFATLHGYTLDELAGEHLSIFHTPEQISSVEAANRQIRETGEFRGEIWHVRRDGTIFPALMHNSLLLDGMGNPIGMIGMLRDITERKRAEEESRQRAAQLEALREVGLELAAQLDLDTLLHSIVSRAMELVGGNSACLYIRRPERDVLESVVVSGSTLVSVGNVLRRGEGLSGKVWETGELLIVDDYEHWEGRAEIYDGLPYKSVIGVPIHWGPDGTRDELLGVLNIEFDIPQGFSPVSVALLDLFAAQSAIAIRNAQLLQAEQEQRDLTEALEEAAAAVSSTLDLDEVLDRILTQVERVVPGDVFNIMRIDEDLTRTVRWRGHERFGMDAEDFISTIAFRVADVPTLRQMMETGKSVIIPDTSADPNWVVRPELEWLCSYVAAPIQVGGTTVGFLNVDGTRPCQFGPADARRLEAFASHAAAAIENAQLYQALWGHAEQLEQRVEERTAELKAQYAWLDAILRSAADGIVVTDGEGSIVQANPVAQAWLAQTLSPEEAGRLREMIRSLATRAEEQPIEFLELTGLDLELSGALVVEEGVEKPTAVVIDIHDVSHLKALDRMKNRFITNISHELRTPITTIKLYAHLMNQYPEKWKGYLDVLAREADRQARLVEGILQISSIDAGRIEMEPRPTPLDELAEATVAIHKILAQGRGLTLKLQPSPSSIPSLAGEKVIALVDPERMMQVLNNLVENAIHYTPEGGSVLVSTGVGEADGRAWATVTVADTGTGIPEDELPHIFDRFFRGEEPRTMQLTGTGLGLAIVKEIVELHGGRVTVQSQAGEGSAFTVWLPLNDRG